MMKEGDRFASFDEFQIAFTSFQAGTFSVWRTDVSRFKVSVLWFCY